MIRRQFFKFKDDAPKSRGGFVYMRGIESRRLYGKQPVSFCILPAFPDHVVADGKMKTEDGVEIPSDAWVPFINEDGVMASWCAELQIARFVGHGQISQRRDVVSRRTIVEFDRDGERIAHDDPYWTVQQFCRNRDSATWGYLQKSQGEWGDPNRIGPALPFLKTEFIVNAVTLDAPSKVVIGEISPRSAVDGLDDLVMAPNKHATDEDLASDYLKGYDNGDITDPSVGRVLVIEKEDDTRMSKYGIRLSSTFDHAKRRAVYDRMKISDDLLRQRLDLSDISSIVNIPTEEGQVDQLVQLLSGRTPDGMFHEYSMLKEAFLNAGHDDWASLVPEPPQAPARGTVRGYSQEPDDEDPYQDEAEYGGAQPSKATNADAQPSAADLPKRWSPPQKAASPSAPPADDRQDPDDPPDTAAQESPASVQGVAGEAQGRPSWVERYRARKAAQVAQSQKQ